MKKKAAALIMATAFIGFMMSGCGKSAAEEEKTDLGAVAEESVGEEKQSETEDETVQDTEEGEEPETPQKDIYIKLKTTQYNGEGKVETFVKSSFNESGYIEKGIVYNGDGSTETVTEYEYDEKGDCIRRVTYDGDGNVTSSEESKYDDEHLLEWTEYDGDGNVMNSSSSEYDGKGNEIKEIYVFTFEAGEEPFKSIYEYEYDDNDNMVRWISYEEDGITVYGTYEYTYDGAGNATSETDYNADGSISMTRKSEYNSDNKITKESTYDADGTEIMMEAYEYDAEGNRTKWESNYYNLNSSSLWEYEYDGENRQTKQTGYKDGVMDSVKDLEYDDYGNMVRETNYDGNGALVSIIENEYIELQDYLASKESIDQEEVKIINIEVPENTLPDAGVSDTKASDTEASNTEASDTKISDTETNDVKEQTNPPSAETGNTSPEVGSGVWVNSASDDVILGDDEYKGDDPNDTGDTTGYTIGY